MPSTPPPSPSCPPRPLERSGFRGGRMWAVAAVAGIVVAGGAVFAVIQSTGKDPEAAQTTVTSTESVNSAETAAAATETAVSTPETAAVASETAVSDDKENAPSTQQDCVDSWNRSNGNRGAIAGIATAQTEAGITDHVNVGYNSPSRSRCMITVANPFMMLAQQYVQDNAHSWGFEPVWTGATSQLDASVADWNAKMDRTGIITLS